MLALTGEIIADLNSSNYSVWEWRWRCLEARLFFPLFRVVSLPGVPPSGLPLCARRPGAAAAGRRAWAPPVGPQPTRACCLPPLHLPQALGGVAARADEERALQRSVATANPKNYQLWNYRRRLAGVLGATAVAEEVGAGQAAGGRLRGKLGSSGRGVAQGTGRKWSLDLWACALTHRCPAASFCPRPPPGNGVHGGLPGP